MTSKKYKKTKIKKTIIKDFSYLPIYLSNILNTTYKLDYNFNISDNF